MANTIAAVGSIAAARQASAMGKYNQQVQERNARVAEQEAEAIRNKNEFDIARFDQELLQLTGSTTVSLNKSGVELSGSGLNVLNYNTRQGEIQKDVMNYNSLVRESKAIESANFARIRGSIERQRGRAARNENLFRAGASLLRGEKEGEYDFFKEK